LHLSTDRSSPCGDYDPSAAHMAALETAQSLMIDLPSHNERAGFPLETIWVDSRIATEPLLRDTYVEFKEHCAERAVMVYEIEDGGARYGSVVEGFCKWAKEAKRVKAVEEAVV
jgi:hypothetical protein